MSFLTDYKHRLLRLDAQQFEALAWEAFHFQASQNPTYRAYIEHLGIIPRKLQYLEQIPFLPIEFYKQHRILCNGSKPQQVFESSGTTGQQPSRHFMPDLSFYEALSKAIFEYFYGPLAQYELLALLPSYLERQTASLVYMVDSFMKHTGKHSGFYLQDLEGLALKISELREEKRHVLLLGVTFALLDWADQGQIDLSGTTVMETGGMKGRRKELLREEVHAQLCQCFGINSVHSEYGMTELTSQGYSKGKGIFQLPPSMRAWLRELNDPKALHQKQGKAGGINIIDLGNIETCCFIETKDIGRIHPEGFEVLGRFDNSDIRGCNLMLQ